jgi:hypothetical protein
LFESRLKAKKTYKVKNTIFVEKIQTDERLFLMFVKLKHINSWDFRLKNIKVKKYTIFVEKKVTERLFLLVVKLKHV